MISRRTTLTLIASAIALPTAALAQQRIPPGQGGTPPGQGGNGPGGQAGGNPGGGKGKNHKNGATLLSEANLKQNGNHGLGKAGDIDVSADVQGGKVVGFHAKHPQKGELTIGKVKSMTKFAALSTVPAIEPAAATAADLQLAQATTTVWYYAYWFTDEYGNAWFYWWPVTYIIDDGSWVIYSA
jgi:hypothetical protein